jgi:hypothetical protein
MLQEKIMENQSAQNFGDWLYKKYINWLLVQESSPKKKKTMADFADFLGISRPLCSQYIHNVRKPSKRVIYNLASVLGSDVFDILGMKQPEPEVFEVLEKWDKLSEKSRFHIISVVRTEVKD